MSTRKIAFTGLFIALAVALGFSFIAVPNFEMISATVFVGGWLLGPWTGILVGFVAEAIYSGINPVGSGLLFPPLYLTQIVSIGLFGLIGGLARRGQVFFLANTGGFVALGILGGILTTIYDLLTTLSYPLTAGFTGAQIWAYLTIGSLLSAVHIVSNTAIFIIIVPGILKAVHSQLGITGFIR